ncbi:spore germination protein KB [Paenibacillus rhizosphaerae]|uniref:Spore germination protein KB n=1 Tax=Paenibacillus rhizosphaerae TaxID=297318 RepID=A0A839TPG7_9BACL|nr:GerAB/ArcD/ProY family transporter [Paenibacillus rhizosphaerae]MBB3126647.1 spore germination protein KB [Paenibacillus rhizosphaerae]
MQKIDKYELIAMMILFLIGTTPLYELGVGAKQDAWLVVIVAMLAGLLLLLVYLFIQKGNEDRNLFEILNQHLGRILGTIVTVAYIFYFSYESMRNTREFGDIINISFLPKTPLSLLMLIMILLSAYAIFKGTEVFFRVVEFLLPFTIFGYFLIFLMFIVSKNIHLERLQPVLEHGIMPVIREAIPKVISFPFGEVVVFLAFWKHLNNKKNLSKLSIFSYLFVGILLLIFNLLNLTILSPQILSITTLPMLRSVRLIEIADFLERLDPVIILLIYIGIFVKMTAFYLGAVIGLSYLIKISHKKLTIIVGAFIYTISFAAPNFIYHTWIGFTRNLMYDFPVFQIWIPLGLAAVVMMKRLFSRKRKRTRGT